MKARLGILISCLICSGAIATENYGICGYRVAHHGTVFSLHITDAFGGGIEYKLCEREEPARNFLLVTRYVSESNKADEPIKVPLNDATYQKLLTLYNDALDYNVKDETMGLDGASWCLETTRGFTYSKACFWSPESNPEERRLTGLLKLGRELLGIVKWERP